jgi:hypothetical protein
MSLRTTSSSHSAIVDRTNVPRRARGHFRSSGQAPEAATLLTAAGEMKCAFGSGVELTETDLPLNDGLCPLGEGRRYGGRDAPLARTEGLRRTGTLVRPAKPGGVYSPAGDSSVCASHALVDFVFLQMSISPPAGLIAPSMAKVGTLQPRSLSLVEVGAATTMATKR